MPMASCMAGDEENTSYFLGFLGVFLQEKGYEILVIKVRHY